MTTKTWVYMNNSHTDTIGNRIYFNGLSTNPDCFAMDTAFMLTNPGGIWNGSTVESFGSQTFVLFSYGDPEQKPENGSDCVNLVVVPSNYTPGMPDVDRRFVLKILYKKGTTYNRIECTGTNIIELGKKYFVYLMYLNTGFYVYLQELTTGAVYHDFIHLISGMNFFPRGGFGSINYSNDFSFIKYRYSFGPYTPTVAQGIYIATSRFWIPDKVISKRVFNGKYYTPIIDNFCDISLAPRPDGLIPFYIKYGRNFLQQLYYDTYENLKTTNTNIFTGTTYPTDMYVHFVAGSVLAGWDEEYDLYLLFQLNTTNLPNNGLISNTRNSAYPNGYAPVGIYTSNTGDGNLPAYGIRSSTCQLKSVPV